MRALAFLFIRVIYGLAGTAARRSNRKTGRGVPFVRFSMMMTKPPCTPAVAPPVSRRPTAPAPVLQPVPAAVPAPQPEPANLGPLNLGLPIGTPAPEFELPALTGEMRWLQALRAEGKDLLLIFSSPT